MVLDWHVGRPGGGPPLHSTSKPSWIAGHALESAFIKPGFTSRRNAIATLTLVSYQWLHALPVRQALRMLDQAVTDYIDAWIAA
jgi:hypothetical protein